MNRQLRVRIEEGGRQVFQVELSGLLEVGRQSKGAGDPEPYALAPAADGKPARLIVARSAEGNVSRRHVLLELLSASTVRVCNTSQVPLPATELEEEIIAPDRQADLALPFRLTLPGRVLFVSGLMDALSDGLMVLDEQTIAPGNVPPAAARLRPLPDLPPERFDALVNWLQVTTGVLQSTIASPNFVHRAAEAVVQVVGLDVGWVLLTGESSWSVAAFYPGDGRAARPSKHILERVLRERRTLWQGGGLESDSESPSLLATQAVVAAPLLDGDGAVIGALYGERRRGVTGVARPVAKLEALLVEMLACGVASGLARVRHQEAAVKAQARFEQFFGPEVAHLIANDPTLLDGREAEVTLLFADIRGFSRVSERLGPAATMRWVNDVLGEFSERVLDEQGVLVDYVGDELLAMWGAPQPQPDHPERAVRAAVTMLAALPALERRWREANSEPLRIGVGVNTGLAQVGNSGSRVKFKYGPLGNSVNLASRVQSLTKQLKCPLLVTGPTRERLSDAFIARRVCRTRVANITGAIDLYEVEPAGAADRRAFFAGSEEALRLLEAGEFAQAARRSGELLSENRGGDGPLQLILSRAANMLVLNSTTFDPVWEPPGK